MKRLEQLQPPASEPRIAIRWREENDPRRLRRVAEVLAKIMDTAGTPGKDGRP